MDINAGTISALNTRVNLAFNKWLKTADPTYNKISMTVGSSSGANFYPRLMELKGMREWLGERVVQAVSTQERFTIVNRTFEETFSVKREDFEDDQYGFLQPIISQLGLDAGSLPDKLVYGLLNNGRTQKGIDGQNYFDTDHPSTNQDGQPISWSNLMLPDTSQGEAPGPAWFLFCTKQPLKPMVFQRRRPFTVTPRTSLNTGEVFHHNEFVWGIDGRCAAGYGMHRCALMSVAPLNGPNLDKAYTQMQMQFRADGTPYETCPDLLVVPPGLRATARKLLNSEVALLPQLAPDGKTWVTGANEWKGQLEMVCSAYLRNDAAKI
ncbi:head protein [Formicincola oecophyllae]|uniref:Head protein n=1 Tax=Formicincola oecophyllae TaxID=2558361 RepID=A0A4Y6UBG6_9PROT|nr:Mu-like prophage major head subunit gpT family protein [Formicincola oecophyllae]QDH13816.1 head protein [Formicincola oecophyllae]